MTATVEPLVSLDVDLRGMSSFMLDVDRLLASELVALGTPEECWAATLLWCRAWKQVPAASLPDDDRVLAAFSGAGKRWPKIKAMALRGFVKCSDGRLYHHVLAAEANAAWKRRQAYSEKRDRDAERLRVWRADQPRRNGGETDGETHDETNIDTLVEAGFETRFVSERDSDVTGQKKVREKTSLRSVQNRGTRLQRDWQPSPEDLGYARSQGMPDEVIGRETEDFRDYWVSRPGAAGVKLDWPAMWRTWIRRSCDKRGFRPMSGNGHANGTASKLPEGDRQWGIGMDLCRKRRQWPSEWGARPNELGCVVPVHLVAPEDGVGWSEWTAEHA